MSDVDFIAEKVLFKGGLEVWGSTGGSTEL